VKPWDEDDDDDGDVAGRRSSDDFDFFPYYEPSRPLRVKGGIKAQSKRGAFGANWWARRWAEVLEGTGVGARLSRGRAYARQGQVISIDIKKGLVTAKVQGSRSRPYRVRIRVGTLTRREWKVLAANISRRPLITARLLAGEMPEEVEQAFAEAGLSLFPGGSGDLRTDCSCPDWINPCKHIAAVYYLLGEEFDRDPFLIFRLRGLEREELAGLVGDRPSAAARDVLEEPGKPLPLSAEPGIFWGTAASMGAPPSDFHGEVRVPPMPAILARRLGSFPFWRGNEPFLAALEDIYRRASVVGLNLYLGRGAGRPDGSDG
jgi:uncharacterized Zn finger protein